jgi:hypothetical protein
LRIDSRSSFCSLFARACSYSRQFPYSAIPFTRAFTLLMCNFEYFQFPFWDSDISGQKKREGNSTKFKFHFQQDCTATLNVKKNKIILSNSLIPIKQKWQIENENKKAIILKFPYSH